MTLHGYQEGPFGDKKVIILHFWAINLMQIHPFFANLKNTKC